MHGWITSCSEGICSFKSYSGWMWLTLFAVYHGQGPKQPWMVSEGADFATNGENGLIPYLD